MTVTISQELSLDSEESPEDKLGDEHPDTLESWQNLIALYEAWNKPEKAEKWRAKLPSER